MVTPSLPHDQAASFAADAKRAAADAERAASSQTVASAAGHITGSQGHSRHNRSWLVLQARSQD